MAEADLFPGLPRESRVRGPEFLCRVIQIVSNEPREETGPKMAATVPCPMRRFHALPCHGVTVLTGPKKPAGERCLRIDFHRLPCHGVTVPTLMSWCQDASWRLP